MPTARQLAGRIAIAAKDDVLLADGDPALVRLAGDVLDRLNCLSLVVASPAVPFADFLVARAPAGDSAIVPRDTETRTFLHDIPFLRASDLEDDPAPRSAALLGSRKGVVVEGVGIVASGALTVEQAYIKYSVRVPCDLCQVSGRPAGGKGFASPAKRGRLRPLSHRLAAPLTRTEGLVSFGGAARGG